MYEMYEAAFRMNYIETYKNTEKALAVDIARME